MKRRSSTHTARRLLQLERRLSREGFRLIAGIDEAGRGPLAGPVVASAVILKDLKFRSRVDDSKKLSGRQRERAYMEIFEKAVVGVGIIDEKSIDLINIYQATRRAMHLAIQDLPTKPDYIIVDGNMKLQADCPCRSVISGDSRSMSIAAASIVAKVTRDRIMLEYDKQYPQYGFARHKGYGTKFHMDAIDLYGPSPIHRRTYHPIKLRVIPK